MFHGVIHKITLAQFFLRHGVYSCKTDAVLSEVHDQWVSRERRVKRTRCLSAVAELLVIAGSVLFYCGDYSGAVDEWLCK